MSFLYESLDNARDNWGTYKEMPQYIPNNLNPDFELRPYQIRAFENFITYFENDRMCQKPTHVLFHMATGSGKTLIMAGLMLYLYQEGYRNFLFFVNLSNIVKKTEENFLSPTSSKYLFAQEINFNGKKVPLKKVENFQNTDPDAINICFTTTQGLHYDLRTVKENSITMDDFDSKKIVLIADEAHHLNVDLQHLNAEEEVSKKSWEDTVDKVFERNHDNILLEFTATCDLENAAILGKYKDKIIFDYSLSKFREDGYSKEIKTLRTDLDIENRALLALILSQYRYKVFQSYKQNVKPVVFFKSKLIKENEENMNRIIEMVQTLTGDQIKNAIDQTSIEVVEKAKQYFIDNNISYDALANELRDDFSEEHCISANGYDDVEAKQILLNTLEEKTNPYRAVFAVDKLNEGWDVLNLFDIVRLYETRDGKNNIPGKTTIKEAQLIGRGARYCPFKISEEQDKFTRKYDSDIDNPLRVCEELYYHCWNEPRYIAELHTALRGIGLDPEKAVEINYVLKESFKKDSLYKEGLVFLNDRVVKSRSEVNGLLPSVRDKVYSIRLATGQSGEDVLLADDATTERSTVTMYTQQTSIHEIADMNYAIVQKAVAAFPTLCFSSLKRYFPNLKSTREFITSGDYLGGIKLDITSKYEVVPPIVLHNACKRVVGIISESISKTEETYEGTTEFKAHNIRDVFKDKKCSYMDVHPGGKGYSQKDNTVRADLRMDLSQMDWFAFEDNFGTSEEKSFVKYFNDYVPQLKEKYDKVYLLRNERQLHIYSFSDGERFEPDYLIFLHKSNGDSYNQLQIFVEPKGNQLVEGDKWKEDFCLQLEKMSVPTTTFVDDNDYRIWGFHFYNENDDLRMRDFKADMDKLISDDVFNGGKFVKLPSIDGTILNAAQDGPAL